MKCPFCGSDTDKVVDSRSAKNGESIRRRRECLNCSQRFTTYEYIEDVSLNVIKADGGREPFDRKKLLRGIAMSCAKRPIPTDKQMRSPMKSYARSRAGANVRSLRMISENW